MKKIYLIPGILFLAVAFITCKPKIEGELGDPADKVKALAGTWELTQFLQQDVNNPIKEERDLSEFYIIPGEEPYKLTLNSDGTYSVDPGPGKNYFGTGGTWSLDNPDFPTHILLFGEDTLQFDLGRIIHDYDNQLNLDLARYCVDATGNSTPTVTYKFNFNRQ